MPRYRLLLVALLAAAAPSPAAEAPQSLLVLDSESGDPVGQGKHEAYTAADARFGGARQRGIGINAWVEGLADFPTDTILFLNFAAERGEKLVPRQYEAPDGSRGPATAGLYVASRHRGCEGPGRFLLSELVVAPGGTVERLAIDFEHTCDRSTAALHGSLRIHSDVPVLPRFGVADFTAPKGSTGTNAAQVTIALSMPAAGEVRVGYETADGTGVAGVDYVATTGIAHFPPGTTSQAIDIPVIGDRLARGDKDFQVRLVDPQGAGIGDGEGRVEILDPNGQVTVAVVRSYGAVFPTGRGITEVFPRKNSAFVSQPAPGNSARFAWLGPRRAFWSADFAAPEGEPLMPGAYGNAKQYPSADPGAAALDIAGDGKSCFGEFTGRFVVRDARYGDDGRLEHFGADFAEHCYGGDMHRVGSIRYRSGFQQLSVSDAVILDGSSAAFTVTLNPPARHRVSVRFETRPGSARPGVDYRSVSRRLVFAPGVSEQVVTVPLLEDRPGDRRFFGRLVAPRRAPLWIQQGAATF